MRLPPPLIDLVARGVVNALISRGALHSDHPPRTTEKVAKLLTADLQIEDEIAEEARRVLAEHQEELRGQDLEYSRLLTKVKAELSAQRKYVLGTGAGRIPRDKAQSLASQIVSLFLEDDDVEYFVKEPELRLAVVRALEDEMRRDALREERAKQKVRSIRRHIPEDSAEFYTLCQQFYRELLERGQ
jgi:hypothetical protein